MCNLQETSNRGFKKPVSHKHNAHIAKPRECENKGVARAEE